MTEPDWHAIAADLVAALDREIEELIYRNRGSTHWEGCEESHPMCAAMKRMMAAKAKAIANVEGANNGD